MRGDAAPAADIDPNDGAGLNSAHDVGWKIIHHRAIDKDVVAIEERRQKSRQGGRGGQSIAQETAPVKVIGPGGQI